MPKGGNGNGGNGSKDPKFVNQAFTTLESPLDGTSLGFVTADVNPRKATWSIVSGNDGGAYSIDPISGEFFIADGSAIDFEEEQTRDLIVQVTENGKKACTATVTINVTDVNEAPVVKAETFSVEEDETSIGTMSASDPEGDPVSYAITDGDPLDLVRLKSAERLAPAVVGQLRHADLAERICYRCALRCQHVYLPKLHNNLFRLVSLTHFKSASGSNKYFESDHFSGGGTRPPPN